MAADAGNGHHFFTCQPIVRHRHGRFAEEERVNDQETMDDVRPGGRRRVAGCRLSGGTAVAVTGKRGPAGE
jgi:hypothetical protein